ncbi:hypothetical protein A0U91_05655 [Acetobacter persici]|uniref:Uncharacterized protein n=1 Tax=Acetobacter persici TaxID=1076596 RepID=A0A1U9LDN7_9PROT|nr:hypothetical protein A0U91_05655 [Acetobacter persici]
MPIIFEKMTEISRKLPNFVANPLCFFALGLAACSTPTFKPICPQIVPWSTEFQHQAAVEIRANPGLAALPEIARQDVVLRDQVRVCRKAAQ